MKKVITVLVFLGVAIGIGLLAQTYPGYILLQVGHWRIQTSLWFALVLLIVVIILARLIIRLISSIGHGFASLSVWRQQYRRLSAQKALTQGILAYSSDKWQEAGRHCQRYAKHSDQPFLHYWFWAQALLKQNQQADKVIELAFSNASDKQKPYVHLLQAQAYFNQRQWQQCIKQLKKLPKQLQQAPLSLKLQCQCLAQQKLWEDLWPIVNQLKQQLGEPLPEYYRQCQQQAFCRMTNKHTQRLSQLKDYWQQLTQANQSNSECAIAFIKQAQKLKPKILTTWIPDWLDNHYSEAVVKAFGELEHIELKDKIAYLQKWHDAYEKAGLSYYLGYCYYRYNQLQQAHQYAQTAWAQGDIKGLLLLLLIYLDQQDGDSALEALHQYLPRDTTST